ncbi:snf2 family helicase atpase [Diplodia corticola]|uniref:Snf2 family helicase atpase n=1 Tax=Diplodia corticola TaxID=236234 RepID=A0A1J9S5B5_9PEZI|nr:snf2 family helicase atpase [Diplodia corticola]OJD35140.1 snf2 family helicase atpase [Diplodia corticola]
MDSDPIAETPAKRQHADAAYNSQDDSGDELFADYNDTMATVPLTHPVNPAAPPQSSPYFASPAPNVTQPTQILDTPVRARTDSNAVVQVPASSPTQHTQQAISSPSPPKSRTISSIAQKGAVPRQPHIPMASAGSFSDSPAGDTSEDELSKPLSRSDIKPSTFVTKSKPRYSIPPPKDAAPSPYQQLLAQYTHKEPTSRPQKRSADDMANAYSPPVKKPRPQQRQTGPSRAQPVDQPNINHDMKLSDIGDFFQAQKVKRMSMVYSGKPIYLLYEALIRKKGQYDDALSYVCELEEEERKKASKAETIDLTEDDASPVKVAKATTNKSKQSSKSIASKYTSMLARKPRDEEVVEIADDSSAAEIPAVKPRGRLMRGRRPAAKSPSPSEEPTPRKQAPEQRTKKAVAIDSDSDASGDEEEIDEQAQQEAEQNLLAYLNACSAPELADLSEKSLKDCEGVLAKRPFKSLDAIRRVELNPPKLTKTGKVPRTHLSTGTKVLNDAEKMWNAYQSISELVEQCKKIGEPIKAAMVRFGAKSLASDASGELNLTTLDDVKNDSGVGTPGSPSQTDDDDQNPVAKSRFTVLKKPSIMAEDLELKDYQLVALNWLNTLWTNKLSGILADDMGLGKTCQVIAFLAHLKSTGQKGIHLIVVPNSTLENWMREFEKFTQKGTMRAIPYQGSLKERADLRALIEDGRNDTDAVVTTYSMMSSTDKNDSKFFRRLSPTVCVFDEGHELRNSSAQKYKCAMRIPAKMRLLLTGTPLQNNLQEMASLLGFIMPDVFAEHADNLNFIFRRKATTTEKSSHKTLLSASRTDKARSMMTPFILRRKKEQVLGSVLPMKTNRVEYCELDPRQKKVYSDVLALQQKAFQRKKMNLPSSGSANYLMKLRLTACHPLLDRNFYDDEKITKMAKAHHEVGASKSVQTSFDYLRKLNDYKIKDLVEQDPDLWGEFEMTEDLKFASGKFQKTVEFVKEYQKTGDRALFFSQFRMVLDVMGDVLTAEGIPFLRFDGSTDTATRQDIIDQFYEDKEIPIFLVSTGSGGTGINITAANKVIIHDLSWNPQEDIQAENRAHRVGQQRDVEVIRLVTRGTIEEQILALGNSKLELDEKVAGAGAFGDDTKTTKLMQNLVEEMLMEQMEEKGKLTAEPMEDVQGSTDGQDIAEQFKAGMQKKGVEMAE